MQTLAKFPHFIPDKGVDLQGLDVVDALHGILDLALVGTLVNEEDEGVVVLNLLHGRLGGQGALDDSVLVHLGKGLHRLALVLGLAAQDQGAGLVEVDLDDKPNYQLSI